MKKSSVKKLLIVSVVMGFVVSLPIAQLNEFGILMSAVSGFVLSAICYFCLQNAWKVGYKDGQDDLFIGL